MSLVSVENNSNTSGRDHLKQVELTQVPTRRESFLSNQNPFRTTPSGFNCVHNGHFFKSLQCPIMYILVFLLTTATLVFSTIYSTKVYAFEGKELSKEDVNRIANAIYKAEGGAKTRHPYGILAKYKKTSPRQACINTVQHKYSDWVASGDPRPFITYLASKYAPRHVSNDPFDLNRNWEKNVRFYMGEGL